MVPVLKVQTVERAAYSETFFGQLSSFKTLVFCLCTVIPLERNRNFLPLWNLEIPLWQKRVSTAKTTKTTVLLVLLLVPLLILSCQKALGKVVEQLMTNCRKKLCVRRENPLLAFFRKYHTFTKKGIKTVMDDQDHNAEVVRWSGSLVHEQVALMLTWSNIVSYAKKWQFSLG